MDIDNDVVADARSVITGRVAGLIAAAINALDGELGGEMRRIGGHIFGKVLLFSLTIVIRE